MDSANSFGSNNYGNANQTPLFVTDRSGAGAAGNMACCTRVYLIAIEM